MELMELVRRGSRWRQLMEGRNSEWREWFYVLGKEQRLMRRGFQRDPNIFMQLQVLRGNNNI